MFRHAVNDLNDLSERNLSVPKKSEVVAGEMTIKMIHKSGK